LDNFFVLFYIFLRVFCVILQKVFGFGRKNIYEYIDSICMPAIIYLYT